jgi:hypothetical protein
VDLFRKIFLTIYLLQVGILMGQEVPVLSDFNPKYGTIGSQVTITGSGFNTSASQNSVYFGATKAIVNSATSNSLVVIVPSGVTYQKISVTNLSNGLVAYSQEPFISAFTGEILFAAKIDYSSGLNPSSLEIGDIDGDRKADIVTANSEGNTFSILRNNHSLNNVVNFNQKVDFETGQYPKAVGISDLDGDGKLDIAIANFSSNNISVYRNNSVAGNFQMIGGTNFITNRLPSSISISDLDGNGKPDIVVANTNGNSLSVLRNLSQVGSIYFAGKVDFEIGNDPTDVKIADVNGDGKPDLVASNFISNSFSVLINTSSPDNISFAAKIDFPMALSPLSLALSDFDNDGKIDLAFSVYGGKVSIFKNQSNGENVSFGNRIDFEVGSFLAFPNEVKIGDIDGDGKPDIAVANRGTNKVSILKNNSENGNISFSTYQDFNTGQSPMGIALGDLNGDGRTDIASVNSGSNTVSIFRQTCEPTVSISVDNELLICNGTPVTFTAFHTNGGDNPTFQWKKNNVNIEGATDVTYSTIDIVDGDAISFIMNPSATCATTNSVASDTKIFTVRGAELPSITIDIISSGGNTVCAGSAVSFKSTITNGGTEPIIQWRKNGIDIPNANGINYSSNSLSNNDIISASLISNASCISTEAEYSNNLTVLVKPKPVAPSIAADNATICKGGQVVLMGYCSVITDSFRWVTPSANGLDSGNSTNAITSVLPNSNTRIITEPGTYKGYCESNTGCGISAQTSVVITQSVDCGSQGFLSVTPKNPIVCPNSSIKLDATGCAGTITWAGGPTLVNGTSATFSPGNSTTYFVQCSTGGYELVNIEVVKTNVVVTNNISTGVDLVKATNSIVSSKKVGNPDFTPAPNVTYEAGGSITLLPGFVAEKHSVFSASIKSCTN